MVVKSFVDLPSLAPVSGFEQGGGLNPRVQYARFVCAARGDVPDFNHFLGFVFIAIWVERI
jgi:hypothetical protein